MDLDFWQANGMADAQGFAGGMNLPPWSPSSCSSFSESDSYSMMQENIDFSSQQNGYTFGGYNSSNCSISSSPTNCTLEPQQQHAGFPSAPGHHPAQQKPHKLKCPQKKMRQRNAANQRERKRMRTINDAFDGLRCRIPDAKEDKKMSKVDTLRMAINYIHHLTDILQSCGGEEGTGPRRIQKPCKQPKQQTVLIRYHHNHHHQQQQQQALAVATCQDSSSLSLDGSIDSCLDISLQEETPLYGHTLSWRDNSIGVPGPDNKLSAKVWMPQHASHEDLANLTIL